MPTDWHSSGIDLAFADGHVKWRKLSAILYSNWVVRIFPLPTRTLQYANNPRLVNFDDTSPLG